MIWAITAPGPISGDINGSAQNKDITNIPGNDDANGDIVFANQLPTPVPLIIPTINDTNIMNGNIFVIVVCTASLAAW